MKTDSYNDRILANRYQLQDLIGKGAMGRVYQAKDNLLGGVIVAVKFLSQALNQKVRDRFEREATICALLGEKTIHIVRVRDYGVDENQVPFYVMEYLQGEGLREIIRRQPLSLPRFISLARQICLGLQCAHQGILFNGINCPIIHRDIKPSNILIVQDQTFGELVKILDFGIAKLQSDVSDNQSFMGTLAYCSPEQIEGKELDNRSDIYSLGIMLFEMLAGELPLMPTNHSFRDWYKVHHYTKPKSFDSVRANLKIPTALEDLVMSCLAKSPKERPQTVVEILQALDGLEERFGKKQNPSDRVKKTLVPVSLDATEELPTSVDKVYHLIAWPKNKPHAEIVFPHVLRTSEETLATLWVMLSQQAIDQCQFCTRYNHFLFSMSPHPMILWITALYNRKDKPRWLPSYLDLKSSLGQQIAQTMAKNGNYRLLFFALEEPEHCVSTIALKIAPGQRQMLENWVSSGNSLGSGGDPSVSKKLLKQEFERLKPQITMKLEALDANVNLFG